MSFILIIKIITRLNEMQSYSGITIKKLHKLEFANFFNFSSSTKYVCLSVDSFKGCGIRMVVTKFSNELFGIFFFV